MAEPVAHACSDFDPVLEALARAPQDTMPESDEERAMVAEAKARGVFVPHPDDLESVLRGFAEPPVSPEVSEAFLKWQERPAEAEHLTMLEYTGVEWHDEDGAP